MDVEDRRRVSGMGWRALASLLGGTAIATVLAGAASAQQSTAPATQLPLISVEGGASADVDDDENTIVARQSKGASKIATPILDTPASISVITAKELKERNVQSTEEALQYTPGVVSDFYGSDDRFDFFKIRGFDAWVYRDGLAIGDPFGGIREEPYAFERVEVLKGANSSSFGVSDPGGSVNYVTKTPRRERFGEVFLSGGAPGKIEGGFDFGDNITEDDTLSYRLTGKIRQGKAEYDYSRDNLQFLMGGLTWRPTDLTTLTVVYDHLTKHGVPGSGGHPVGSDLDRSRFFGEPDYNSRRVDRDTVSVMLDHDFGTGLTFGSNARYSSTGSDFGYAYISATPPGTTIVPRSYFGNESTRRHFIVDGRLQYDANFGAIDSRSLVGVEYNNDNSSTKTYFGPAPSIDWMNPIYRGRPPSVPLIGDTTSKQNNFAVYAQQDLTFNERFIASVGLRNDWLGLDQTNNLTGVRVQASPSEFTKRAALTYKVTDQVSTYVSYAESVVPPSLTVQPERGRQWELGVKYQPDRFPALFSAAVYDLTKSNITRTNPATNLPETIGKARVRGIDLEAKAELTNNISLIGAYSNLMSTIVENGTAGNVGNELSFVPNNVASLWLNYELPENGRFGAMNFGVGARYAGRYFFNDANTQSTAASIVFDASFTYQMTQKTALQLNVNNIFDEKHVAYGGFGADFYNPGRAISATLRHSW